MITNLHKYKPQIAAGLLVAFLSVFLCSFLCDFNIVSIRGHQAIETLAVQKHSHGHEDHNHQHDNASSSNHHEHGNTTHGDHHGQDSQSTDDCCEELTNAIYSSLINQKTQISAVNAKFSPLSILSLPAFIQNTTTRIRKDILLYYNLPPPLKGIDVRILIQSFLN